MTTKSTVTAQVLPPPASGGSAVGSRPRQPESLSESQFSSLLSAICRSPSGASTASSQILGPMFGKRRMKRPRRPSIEYTAKSRMSSSVKLTRSKRGSTRRSRRACGRPRPQGALTTVDDCQPIWHFPSAVRVVYSDASDTGYGGYVVEHGPCVAYGQWTTHEAHQSSTWRELTAVRVLSAVAVKLMNFRVRWFTDNQNVARILYILLVGSKMALFEATALKIFSLSVQHQIRLEPEWIPRGEPIISAV